MCFIHSLGGQQIGFSLRDFRVGFAACQSAPGPVAKLRSNIFTIIDYFKILYFRSQLIVPIIISVVCHHLCLTLLDGTPGPLFPPSLTAHFHHHYGGRVHRRPQRQFYSRAPPEPLELIGCPDYDLSRKMAIVISIYFLR